MVEDPRGGSRIRDCANAAGTLAKVHDEEGRRTPGLSSRDGDGRRSERKREGGPEMLEGDVTGAEVPVLVRGRLTVTLVERNIE